MSDLCSLQCQACNINAIEISEDEIRKFMTQIPDWQIVNEDATRKLRRAYNFTNFVEAMAFANELSQLAEQEFHHPDLFIKWGGVTVTWWSHEMKGLHMNDFILAARTDLIF